MLRKGAKVFMEVIVDHVSIYILRRDKLRFHPIDKITCMSNQTQGAFYVKCVDVTVVIAGMSAVVAWL